jgi:uncharacterized OB-fold protein
MNGGDDKAPENSPDSDKTEILYSRCEKHGTSFPMGSKCPECPQDDEDGDE